MTIDFPTAPAEGQLFERWRWQADKWIQNNSASTAFLPLTGGTMSGPIVLAGNATANLNPVPLQQLNSRLALYLPLTGGALSGSLSVTGTMVASGLVQGNPVNSTGDLTAGGNIGTNNVVYAGAVQTPAFYGNPTFTGSINVNGNITTPGAVYAGAVQTPVLSGSVTVTGNEVVNGNLQTLNTLFAAAVSTPQLNGNVYCTGNFNAAGQVQGNSLYARDRVDAAGGIFAGNLFQTARGDDYAFYAPSGGITVATAMVSVRGGGQLGLYLPYSDASIGGSVSVGQNMTANGTYGNYVHSYGDMHCNGNFGANGSVNGATLTSSGNVYARNDGNFGLVASGGGNAFSMGPGYYLEWEAGTGNFTLNSPAGRIFAWTVGGFCWADRGPTGGNGDYVNISDRRSKDADTIIPTTRGLPEILQLQPVEFKRLPAQVEPPAEGETAPVVQDPKLELGFIAQDVAPIIPEAVNIIGIILPDGTGGMDTAEPSLGVTSGAIVAALVNAVKTLDQRLKTLEGT